MIKFFHTIISCIATLITGVFLVVSQLPNVLYDKPNGKRGETLSIARVAFVSILAGNLTNLIIRGHDLKLGWLYAFGMCLVYILSGKVIVPWARAKSSAIDALTRFMPGNKDDKRGGEITESEGPPSSEEGGG